ncbi:MAG: hypothetical protein ICV74_09735 [Thermoleophilia bacterium]|nr:hypothetical protein [Thermoleophilia bacterium]
MPELERELRELGASLAYPPTPDLGPAVLATLEAAPPPLRWRRSLVLALAALAAALAAAMAVPQARTAILEWLGLRGVTIERVETAPTATSGLEEAELDLGTRVSLADARRRVRYRLAPPPTLLGEPDAVYLDERSPGPAVAYVYRGAGGRVRLLLTQFRASLSEEFIYKAVGPGTDVQPVEVRGRRGWWLHGEPHEFVYTNPQGEPFLETLRLAANTLLWQRGGVTYRVEGEITRARALAIAGSFQ